jgi:hypothetical protein
MFTFCVHYCIRIRVLTLTKDKLDCTFIRRVRAILPHIDVWLYKNWSCSVIHVDRPSWSISCPLVGGGPVALLEHITRG